MKNHSIPVLYYHRVGAPDPSYLSISTADFERQLKYLKGAGYTSVSIKELIEYLSGRVELPPRSVCITFDDGFIDNLVYAHPLLQKYDCRAALFIATSLIRPENQAPASAMTDFNQAHTLARRGDFSHFLSQKELKEMVAGGVWEVLSHSHRHNQVFTSTEVTGFYPDSDNHWGIISAWGRALDNGRWPVYTRGAGLVNRAWIPDEKNDMKLVQESEEDFEQRVSADLRQSLQIIKEISADASPVICWPWGRADARLETIAARAGYVAALRTDTGANVPGMNLMRIHRFAIKKPDLARFKLGLHLRRNAVLAKIYALFRK